MKLLVVDHFFGQDIEALAAAAGDGAELRAWNYHPIRWEALRVFPLEVGTGVEAYAAPEMEARRRRFAAVFERLLGEQFMRFPFDALVAPSDVFFYLRTAAAACHRLGVPFLVAQKETSIADHTMREHAARIARYAPPTHDHMTVCSQRHKEFWLRAGAAEESITVTGQPRFDFYARLGSPPSAGNPTVLFFSYHVDAYHPEEGAAPVWSRLHAETLAGLAKAAARGWRVLVKPHPQQPPPRLPAGIELVDGRADTRDLIVAADVVVGFQTTALFEAMVAGKPVIYTGWDPEAQRLGRDLLPFSDWGEGITVVEEPERLADAITAPHPIDEQVMAFRRDVVESFLGPVDGRAAERTLTTIAEVVEQFAGRRTSEAAELRASLAGQRPPRRLVRRALMKADTARAMARAAVRR